MTGPTTAATAIGRRSGRPVPPPPAGVRSGPRRSVETTRAVQGIVDRLTLAPMGEVDGAIFDNGTINSLAPDLADRFSAVVARGDRVKVTGWSESGPAGDTDFECETITNIRTNATASANGARPVSASSATAVVDGSTDFAPRSDRTDSVETRLNAVQDQIDQLRAEIRSLRRQH